MRTQCSLYLSAEYFLDKFTTEIRSSQRGFLAATWERSTKILEITLTTFRVRSCELVDRGSVKTLTKNKKSNFVLQRLHTVA
jgi:hypothetical protein